MKQTTFASAAWANKGKVTRREQFLAEMDAVIPWARLLALRLQRARIERIAGGGVREARQHEFGAVDTAGPQPGYEDAATPERDFTGDLPMAIGAAVRILSPGAMSDMKPITVSTEIPAEEFERHVAELTAGSLEDALARIAFSFVPDTEMLADRVRKRAREFPLSNVFELHVLDYRGRPAARIGSTDDDLDGRVVHELAASGRGRPLGHGLARGPQAVSGL
jgi:hypothetical protein